MLRRSPRSTRTAIRFPYPTLFRSLPATWPGGHATFAVGAVVKLLHAPHEPHQEVRGPLCSRRLGAAAFSSRGAVSLPCGGVDHRFVGTGQEIGRAHV